MFNKALVLLALSTSSAFAVDADLFWGQWHGPADGRACLAAGSTGPALELAHTLDFKTALEYTQNELNDIFANGVMVRADDRYLYLKKNKDYFPAQKVLWKIDPETGTVLWHTDSISAGEDMASPRAFQLYNDPRGFNSLHVQPYYDGRWDTYRLDKDSTENLLSGSHCCLGSRILMGKWAWQNQEGGVTWHHRGRLMLWNGSGYAAQGPELIQVQDHAWEKGRCVLFVLSGWEAESTWDAARFLVLDTSGAVIQDSPVEDIHRPVGAASCYYGTAMGNLADTADILMKLAVKGDYVYGIERASFEERQLVRRRISNGFVKTDSVILGTDPLLSNSGYCVGDSTVYLQGTDTVTAYSSDLRTVRWKRSIPHRTLFHAFVQGIDRLASPGIRNKIMHSMACDPEYVYCVTDSHLLVLDQATGETLFDHTFTDLPSGTIMYYPTVYTGPAGTVTLLPDYVVVNSVNICSKLWIFRKIPAAAAVAPAGPGRSFALKVSPNPARTETVISAAFPGWSEADLAQEALLEVFNVRGVRQSAVRTAPEGLRAGITWKSGRLPAGLYCARLTITGKTTVKNIMVVK